MITFEGLDENFKFIVLEVTNQANSTRRFLESPTRELFEKITSRDDYIDNLKTIIENKCYSRINSDTPLDDKRLNKIRAIQVMCVNLEKIADYFVNIVHQMGYLEDQSFIGRYDNTAIFDVICSSMECIRPAFSKEDMTAALSICKVENELDRLFKINFDRIMTELAEGGQTQNLITSLFIHRYFERVGDALLNIGEAIIFSILGERIKIEQFEALKQTLTKSGFSDSFSDIDFQAIWGSRSGCRIGRVEEHSSAAETTDTRGSIYKEGNLEKIRKERDNIIRWKSIFPGLVANIYGYHEEEDKGSLLVEFLSGCTLDEVVLTADNELLANAIFVFEQTVRNAWRTTLKPVAMKTDYMRQLMARKETVLQVHPELQRTTQTMGGTTVLSSDDLVSRCMLLEEQLEAPFSVFIHGDFNINNLVYDHSAQQIRYIDLYRSRDSDYLQDVSVFLVSNFRMPVFQKNLRMRINRVIDEFFSFAESFAKEQNDHTWQARLGFALARSFYTSTRFELNHSFAREMYNRSLFLLEKLERHAGQGWDRFVLPKDVLFY
ncbi:MAG: phosphotransferase [Proteobacteria bacterium]|nr:phosphotransferase [Pseudomonadota bacterium]